MIFPFALAAALATAAQTPAHTQLVFDALEHNPAAADQAEAVSALLARSLAEESGLEVVGEGAPVAGARFRVRGRLDRFGEQFLLAASIQTEGSRAEAGRVEAESLSEDGLPRITRWVARELVKKLGPAAPGPGNKEAAVRLEDKPPAPGPVYLGLKTGPTFLYGLKSLNLGADFEVGVHLDPEWLAFLEVGLTFLRAKVIDPVTGQEAASGLTVLPTLIGMKHRYRVDKTVQPYWGLGLGVQLSFGDYGFFQKAGPLPAVFGAAGVDFAVSQRVRLGIETGTSLSQAILGFQQDRLGKGLNLDLAATAAVDLY